MSALHEAETDVLKSLPFKFASGYEEMHLIRPRAIVSFMVAAATGFNVYIVSVVNYTPVMLLKIPYISFNGFKIAYLQNVKYHIHYYK